MKEYHGLTFVAGRRLQVFMDDFERGVSMRVISLNWSRIQELLVKLNIVVSPRLVDGIRNFKDGAAELLLRQLHGHFTGRRINRRDSALHIDFTDHSYQVLVLLSR